jgi:hypothetical protein
LRVENTILASQRRTSRLNHGFSTIDRAMQPFAMSNTKSSMNRI